MLLIASTSIAGLWSALAAADHFEDVLIVEPEAWVGTDLGTSNSYDAKGDCVLEKTPPRTRVMQYANSIHGERSIIVLNNMSLYPCYQSSSLWRTTP